MILLVAETSQGVEAIGEQAEPGELLTCEGCGQKVKQLFEDAGMNKLCKDCIALGD